MTRCLDCHARIVSGSRCPACATAYARRRNAGRDERARKAQRGGSGWAASERRRQTIERDGGCVMPGPHSGPLKADHIIPLSRGGTDTPDNRQTLCDAHHRAKTRQEARR